MTAAASSIEQLFKQVEAAGASFFAGDPVPIIALWSRANDVTIFGGSGSYAQGWQAIEPRIRWAAAHFRGGRGALEAVTMGESGDLAYTISIERGEVQGETVWSTMVARNCLMYPLKRDLNFVSDTAHYRK
ncbi:MAG TPA: hypothetical protein VFU22_29285 [Roseiflexaceae bacterium]|nr:hypothetical protein [Roseiflexaceae bacterium]